jgi:chromosome segregation ATPase
MSKVYNKYRVPGEPDTWYVKMSDGSIYGPETYSTVYGWAAEGRIAPGDQMSHDKITWVFAENVAKLKMDWIAEMDGNRKYGPFNLLAVPNLVRHGTFKNDARIVNRFSGKTLPIEDVLKPAAVAAELAVQNDLVSVRNDAPNVGDVIPPVQYPDGKRDHHKDKEIRHRKESDTEHHARDLDQQLTKAQNELADARRAFDELQRRHQESEDEKRKELERLRDEMSRLEREKSAATDAIEELKKGVEHEKSLVAALQSSSNEKEKDLTEQIGILQSNVAALNRALEETTTKFEEQKLQLLSLGDQKKDVEQDVSQRLARLINQAQSTQDALDTAEINIKEQQKRISALSQEKAAAEETVKRLNGELQGTAGEKAKILDEHKALLEKVRNEHGSLEESSRKKEQEFQKAIDGKSAALEQAAEALEKEKSRHLEAQARCKEVEKRYADDVRNLKSQVETSTKLLDENKALAERSREKEKELMNSLDEQAELMNQIRNELDKERKGNEAYVRSLKQADEATQQELDENSGLLERLKRDLEKEKSLRVEADEKRKKAEELLEAEMRNLKAQTAGVTTLLEAARSDLNKEREGHDTLTRAIQEKEKQLLAAFEEKAQLAGAAARSSEQVRKLEQKIAETGEARHLLAAAQAELEKERAGKKSLSDAAAKEAELTSRIEELEQEIRNGGARNVELTPQLQDVKSSTAFLELQQENEQLVQRLKELEDKRSHVEILPQETVIEPNIEEEKGVPFVQEAETKQQETVEQIEKPQEETVVNKWYFRTEDGSVYGPVDIAELCEWAGQCRILPSHEVSQDQMTWVPAGNIPDLKMDWIVDLPDGNTYGPVNALALQDLVREGLVSIDARVVNRNTQETVSLDQLLQSLGVDLTAIGKRD